MLIGSELKNATLDNAELESATLDNETTLEKARPSWGLLPDAVIDQLRQKEWLNVRALKKRMKGSVPFPVSVLLKPPRGRAVMDDIQHFQTFVSVWQAFANETEGLNVEVYWEERGFRHFAEPQRIPKQLLVHDIQSLAGLLGCGEQAQLRAWQDKIAYMLSAVSIDSSGDADHKKRALFMVLIDHLETVDSLSEKDMELLVKLMPQLQQGMGQGGYLRALPVVYVDTKFVENHLKIIESMVSVIAGDLEGVYQSKTVNDIGLLQWLDCKPKPKDWLLIKPLCDQTKAAMGGMPLLRLSSDTLFDYPLPADNILIVENEQSCLALPETSNTIAVSGGGKNVTWMKAAWLTSKRVGYWGDIDSEGLAILSDARGKLSTLTPLMMDERTLLAYQDRMVDEPDSVAKEPIALTEREIELFRALRSKQYQSTRLEQERLPVEYVRQVLGGWLDGFG